MKSYYTDYSRHCLRFYVKHPNPKFKDDISKDNWEACDLALSELDEKYKNIIMAVYSKNDTLEDNVFQVSKDYGIYQDSIWKLLSQIDRKIAKHRRLLH